MISNRCASSAGKSCDELFDVSAIAAGNGHTCAILDAGQASCWGSNFRGGLGDGAVGDRANPFGVEGLDSGVVLLAGGPGSRHKCAETVGGLLCWGSNLKGQLGVGSSDDEPHSVPLSVFGLGPKGTPTATPPVADTPVPTATADIGGLNGDVDCSEAVNAIDAAFLLQFVAGLIEELPCKVNADANEDGDINTIDAALVLQFSAGLLGTLPP